MADRDWLLNPAEVSDDERLAELLRLINGIEGFALVFAIQNNPGVRDQLISQIETLSRRRQAVFVVPPGTDNLLAVDGPVAEVTHIVGIEHSVREEEGSTIPLMIARMNLNRNAFPSKFPGPIVLWIPRFVHDQIRKQAYDFYSVRSAVVTFSSPSRQESASATSLLSSGYRTGHDTIQELRDQIADLTYRLESADERDQLWLKSNLAKVLVELTTRSGDPEHAQDAVRILQNILDDGGPSKITWAMTQNNLGNALGILGERSGNETTLQEAVTAYRAALEVYTREASPMDWAMTQNNLGNALQTLGERSGTETTLQEAVTAYRAALEVRTRGASPMDWATTQNNLGAALRILGERSGNETTLQEAVTAYRAALEVRTRETSPMDWATTQNNLGNVLRTLGERSGDESVLQEAVNAFRAALEVQTRETSPMDWAMTQNNLGNALLTVGERSEEETVLQEAVTAYRAALEVYTREASPMDWAMTTANLGNCQRALSVHRKSCPDLEKAVAVILEAVEVYQSAGAAGLISICVNMLRDCLAAAREIPFPDLEAKIQAQLTALLNPPPENPS